MAADPLAPPHAARPRAGGAAGRRRWPVVVCALAIALALASCETDQDPGLDPGIGDGPAQTSDTLGACPPGGPDATTPAAGCLGPDGSVQRP